MTLVDFITRWCTYLGIAAASIAMIIRELLDPELWAR